MLPPEVAPVLGTVAVADPDSEGVIAGSADAAEVPDCAATCVSQIARRLAETPVNSMFLWTRGFGLS